jgi:hypothetical protein
VIVFAQNHAVLVSEKFALLFRRERSDDLLEARIAAEPAPKVASVPTYQSSGLARMERANPLVAQMLEVVGAFTALQPCRRSYT